MCGSLGRPLELRSLAVAQGEMARYSRTGAWIHLAYATRELEDALKELHELRRRAFVKCMNESPGSSIP